jgi:hypothetical protein
MILRGEKADKGQDTEYQEPKARARAGGESEISARNREGCNVSEAVQNHDRGVETPEADGAAPVIQEEDENDQGEGQKNRVNREKNLPAHDLDGSKFPPEFLEDMEDMKEIQAEIRDG